MPKIKLTKTELKSQRDALKQFTRFLPTLQLKKQQLQVEMRQSQARLRENEAKEKELKSKLDSWVSLFGTDGSVDKLSMLVIKDKVNAGRRNIAGVDVPVFDSVTYSDVKYNLFDEDPWIDSAIEILKEIIAIRAAHVILQEQYRLLSQELRTTTQRVNLFEKVKIPEAKGNIRKIQIYLGDMDTAAVARSKIAKGKSQEVAA